MDTVREIEMSETIPGDKPVYEVKIASCGVLAEGEPDGVVVDLSDPYPTFPEDLRKNGGDIEGVEPSVSELLKISDVIREKGNEVYKAKDLTLAVRKYQKSLRYLDFEKYPSVEEQKQIDEAKAKVLGNLAACYLGLKSFQEVIATCNKVLDVDPENVKALNRRGQAYLNMKDYDESIKDFKKVLAIAPEDATAKKNYALAAKKNKEIFEKQAQLFKRAFA
jgi:tetratricopeptide (TPR) repeat protein